MNHNLFKLLAFLTVVIAVIGGFVFIWLGLLSEGVSL